MKIAEESVPRNTYGLFWNNEQGQGEDHFTNVKNKRECSVKKQLSSKMKM